MGEINMDISEIVARQKAFFQTGRTLPVTFRIDALKHLYRGIQEHETEIQNALQTDLGKSDYEGFMCETGLVLSEISYMLRHIRGYSRAHTVHTPLVQFAAKSFVKPVPYGNTLILSPWNYPFLLTLEPLADAIAAGNTAVVKPSAYAPATGEVIARLLGGLFPPEYVAVVTGGRKENTTLLEQKFDMIFFTGSQSVGREVLRHAAENLTPAVLELGGKSPCIVDETADIRLAARRIVFGKYLNCGQTCVAPDYILCQESVREKLLDALCAEIKKQFGEAPLQNPDYGKIINRKHMERLLGLIVPDKVVIGGEYDEQNLKIAPTVMDHVTEDDAVMQEEIFGPILPVLTFSEFDQLFPRLNNTPKPLALYIFSSRRDHIQAVTSRIPFGGGCINDAVMHLVTSEMGFGGVGESGMGSYHGKAGFDAFSHRKSILDKKTWIDLPMRYQPYRRSFSRLI